MNEKDLTERQQRNFDRRTEWAQENAELITPEGYYWIPSPHYNEREDRDIAGIVIHTTEGWSGGAKTFQGPDRRASAHFGIERSGLITQMVNEKDRAWHAGSRIVNDFTIGIEHAGFADEKAIGDYLGFSREQIEASAQLVAKLLHKYNLPPTRAHVFGHAEVGVCKGRERAKPGEPRLGETHGGASCHYDPGPYWNWDDYMDRVGHYYYGGHVARNVIGMAVIIGSASLAIAALTYRGVG